jgi:putative copper export protein
LCHVGIDFESGGRAVILAAELVIRALHLIAAAVFAGGLVFLALAVGVARTTVPERERIALFRGLGRRFALVGGVALLVLIGTGVDMADERIPSWSDLTDTEYGDTLSAKLVLVVFVILLTLVHSVIQGPALSRLREQAIEHPDDTELQARLRTKNATAGAVRGLILIATIAILVLAARLVTG